MQLLLSRDSLARTADRLAPLTGGLDMVTVEKGGVYRRGEAEIDGSEVDPEIIWLSLDMYGDRLLPTVLPKIMQSPAAKWMQGFMAGLDNPAFKMIIGRGVRLTKSDAQAPVIAEYVMAHALALLHPIRAQAAAQAAGEWRRIAFREVASTRWLMIGYGNIGQEVARRLKPFGAHLTIARRTISPDPLVDAMETTDALPRLLPEADVVVIAAALTDETRDLADEGFFQAMKPGALLINVARGEIVDEDALRGGLDRDQPVHAVLDVFRTEPLPAGHWAWTHPKVTLTAHCSNMGDGLEPRSDALFLENLRRYRAGEPLKNEAQRSEVGL